MRRKLFLYMLILVVIVIIAVLTGLSLIGRFNSIEDNYYEKLNMQIEVFEKDIINEFDHLAFMGVRLSENMADILHKYYDNGEARFDGSAVPVDTITEMQEEMIEPIRDQLLKTDCSGVFVMMNATVDNSVGNDKDTRSGIYLQKSSFVSCDADDKLLLYRGSSQVSRRHGIMPHRKWKLEFTTDNFPDYEISNSKTEQPVYNSYHVSNAFMLPGTSDKAILVTVPVVDDEGNAYGLCGFEVSESYFKSEHSQPSGISHLTCIITEDNRPVLNTDIGLSSGVENGYYKTPDTELTYTRAKGNLLLFKGDKMRSVGLIKSISLHSGEAHAIAVITPEKDYKSAVTEYTIKTIILLILLIAVTICTAMYLTRRFVAPILKTLEHIKIGDEYDADSELQEINDLFAFLSDKDKKHEEKLQALELEKQKAEEAYQKAQSEIDRLAYSRKSEIDPDDYQYFIEGISMLTPTERTIFEHYLEGHSVKEIMELADIKESTVRYHNQNIYRKLGVNSLKQMLRYATLWKQENEKE